MSVGAGRTGPPFCNFLLRGRLHQPYIRTTCIAYRIEMPGTLPPTTRSMGVVGVKRREQQTHAINACAYINTHTHAYTQTYIHTYTCKIARTNSFPAHHPQSGLTNLAKQNNNPLGLLDAASAEQVLGGLAVDASIRQVKPAAVVARAGCLPQVTCPWQRCGAIEVTRDDKTTDGRHACSYLAHLCASGFCPSPCTSR